MMEVFKLVKSSLEYLLERYGAFAVRDTEIEENCLYSPEKDEYEYDEAFYSVGLPNVETIS